MRKIILPTIDYKEVAGQIGDFILRGVENHGYSGAVVGLSGGVDSSVTALLLQKAIGDKLYCVFVNNGVLRKDEHLQVVERFKKHM